MKFLRQMPSMRTRRNDLLPVLREFPYRRVVLISLRLQMAKSRLNRPLLLLNLPFPRQKRFPLLKWTCPRMRSCQPRTFPFLRTMMMRSLMRKTRRNRSLPFVPCDHKNDLARWRFLSNQERPPRQVMFPLRDQRLHEGLRKGLPRHSTAWRGYQTLQRSYGTRNVAGERETR